MDVIIAIFVFFISFLLVALGLSYKNPTVTIFGSVLFLLFGIMIIYSPIQVVTGSSTIQNVTAVNVTEVTETLTYTDAPGILGFSFSWILAFLFIVMGLFFTLISYVTI